MYNTHFSWSLLRTYAFRSNFLRIVSVHTHKYYMIYMHGLQMTFMLEPLIHEDQQFNADDHYWSQGGHQREQRPRLTIVQPGNNNTDAVSRWQYSCRNYRLLIIITTTIIINIIIFFSTVKTFEVLSNYSDVATTSNKKIIFPTLIRSRMHYYQQHSFVLSRCHRTFDIYTGAHRDIAC